MIGLAKMPIENRGMGVSVRLIASRNYPESAIMGPYQYGREFGVLFESTATPHKPAMDILDSLEDEIDWPI